MSCFFFFVDVEVADAVDDGKLLDFVAAAITASSEFDDDDDAEVELLLLDADVAGAAAVAALFDDDVGSGGVGSLGIRSRARPSAFLTSLTVLATASVALRSSVSRRASSAASFASISHTVSTTLRLNAFRRPAFVSMSLAEIFSTLGGCELPTENAVNNCQREIACKISIYNPCMHFSVTISSHKGVKVDTKKVDERKESKIDAYSLNGFQLQNAQPGFQVKKFSTKISTTNRKNTRAFGSAKTIII